MFYTERILCFIAALAWLSPFVTCQISSLTRRADNPSECGADSCLLGKFCVESRRERFLQKNETTGICECMKKPHICELVVEGRFECINMKKKPGMKKNEDGSCACESDHCVANIELRHEYKYKKGMIIRRGLDMNCKPQTPTLVADPRRDFKCTCVGESCQLGDDSPSGPNCVSLAERPELVRTTHGRCGCGTNMCMLSPDPEQPLECKDLATHPQYFRKNDSSCGCAAGYCRGLGKFGSECFPETHAFRRSNFDFDRDFCACSEGHCELRHTHEEGRVCVSLADHPLFTRINDDSPSTATCACRTSEDICQYGFGFMKEGMQCLSTQNTGFFTNEHKQCDCAKDHCVRKDKQPLRCVKGERKVPWELDCA
eukprot:TRINITY_DN1919_c0_g1_i1.p1 TRINITY_DN1919_c0_g1~~TRINITY_DN1919_c0_g1_i1.p1  ORF type:complete len:372 (-),score=59.30 TRINITY_DN1919_c0_g1_i1:254-1369(-)